MPFELTKTVREEYEQLFASLHPNTKDSGTISWYVAQIVKNMPRYEAVSAKLGGIIPAPIIACVHAMESSFNFNAHLHNGDPLSARTVQVPAGRPRVGNPPFTWEESAMDALKSEAPIAPVPLTDIAYWLWWLECFNGTGYRTGKGRATTPPCRSPYLWSMSQHYERGKYVADGVFDPWAISAQCGAAVMLKVYIDKFMPLPPTPPAKAAAPSWFRLTHDEKGLLVVGMDGSVPLFKESASSTRIDDLIATLTRLRKQYPNAETITCDLQPVDTAKIPVHGQTPDQPPKEVICRLTRVGGKDYIGCDKLKLEFVGTGDYMIMRSGVPTRQTFRKADDPSCVPGSLEPIPQPPRKEQHYYIHDIEWAGGRDNYTTVFSDALGPCTVYLEPTFNMRRGEFLFHVDGGAPGTAGCVAVAEIAELKQLIALLRKHNPRKLFVDWGL